MLARTNPEPKKANPIDVHVGARIRLRRNMIGMSQEKLAERLGVSFQQVQKYEKGTNRVGASRLQAIADALNVPPSHFFEDSNATGGGGDVNEVMSFITSAEGIALTRAFVGIKDTNTRQKVIALVKAISAPSAEH